jgi:hypothetical protein
LLSRQNALKSLILAAALLPFISAAPVAVAETATDTSLYERGTAYATIKNRNPTVLNEKAADYSIVKEREAEEQKREELYIDANYYGRREAKEKSVGLYIGTNYYDKRGEEERGRICILA